MQPRAPVFAVGSHALVGEREGRGFTASRTCPLHNPWFEQRESAEACEGCGVCAHRINDAAMNEIKRSNIDGAHVRSTHQTAEE
jgi:hypothetical protein